MSIAARTARAAWSATPTGAPNTASISSPTNCRTRPPCPVIARAISVK